MQKNVLVFFGGRSCENEVSIITGVMAANLLDETKYRAYSVYLTQSGEMYTGDALLDVSVYRQKQYEQKAERALLADGKLFCRRGKKLKELCKIDVGLNCCHGICGEDGAVSGLLDVNGIPNASPDMAGSAVFMDKAMTKLIAKALGIKALPFFRIAQPEYRKRGAMAIRCIEERLGYPVIVKPARQGSSIGISVAENREQLAKCIETGFAYDTVLLAEKYLSQRREINCAAYRSGDELIVSECEEPKTENKFLTFVDKYLDGGKDRASDFPAKISAAQADRIKGYTKLLYRRMNLRGIVRADYIISGGEVYFNEMNTVPGSLAWYLFCDKMSKFSNLLSALIEQGISEFSERQGKKMLQNCGVLSGAPAKGRKRR